MKRKMLRCALLGFPLGVWIGYTITILVSLFLPDGAYSPVVPEMVQDMGSERTAVIVQYLLCGILGSASAAGTLIWQSEKLSILQQTVYHFLLLSITMLPTAYFCHWMEHSIGRVLGYVGIFAALYVSIWCGQMWGLRRRVKKMNERLKQES